MRRSEYFTDAVPGDARSRTRRLVVHPKTPDDGATTDPPRAGLVVSTAVGNAVERNLVKRRLRGLLATRMSQLGEGEKLVVRALPEARDASSSELGADVDSAVERARRRRERR